MPRRLTAFLLSLWLLISPSGPVWANVAPPLVAGNNLTAAAGHDVNIVTARETDSSAYSAHSKNVDDVRQTYRDSGKASSLKAGGNLTLKAGNTLLLEGAKVQAGNDATLDATTAPSNCPKRIFPPQPVRISAIRSGKCRVVLAC